MHVPYQFHLFDLTTRTYIDTLPLEDVSFGWELRGVGRLRAQVPLRAEQLNPQRIKDATIPYRTKIYVERGNELVWGGWIVPTREYQSSSGTLNLEAEETIGYLGHRYMPTVTYTQWDQLDIARDMVNRVQAVPGGSVDLLVETLGPSNVLRDRTYNVYDYGYVLTALTDLSEVENGFEFITRVVWTGDRTPQETLQLGYPKVGRPYPQAVMVLEHEETAGGGSILDYRWPEGPGLATHTYATADLDDGTRLAATASNTALIDDGWPMLEQATTTEGLTSSGALAAHANAIQAASNSLRIAAQFTVVGRDDTELGRWSVGDWTLVRITDSRHPAIGNTPGWAGYMRITAAEVSISTDGEETYELTMAERSEIV